jgi:putative hydrolase of the HAD superfamily
MDRKRILLWDFDGTLARREGGWTGTLHAILREHEPDLPVTLEDVRPWLQAGFPWHTPDVPHTHLNDSAERWWQELEPLFGRAFEQVGVAAQRAQRLAALVRPTYLREDTWGLYPDALPTLQRLTELGWEHAILSNHVPELPLIVEWLGVAPWVERVFNSATLGYEKPHPRIFAQALEALASSEVSWMIGDNYQADVLGARGAGLPAILVRREHADAPLCCASLAEVIEIVQALSSDDGEA